MYEMLSVISSQTTSLECPEIWGDMPETKSSEIKQVWTELQFFWLLVRLNSVLTVSWSWQEHGTDFAWYTWSKVKMVKHEVNSKL